MSGNAPGQDAFVERLRFQIEAYHASALVYAAIKLGLPDRMGPRAWTPEQLAEALHLSAPHLLRFLRGLCTIGICAERADGKFALAPGGHSLKTASPSRLAEKVQIVVGQYWAPWAGLVSCLQTGAPAFEQVFGKTVWDWRRAHAEQGALFDTYVAKETVAQADAIVGALDFPASGPWPRSPAVTADCSPRSCKPILILPASCSIGRAQSRRRAPSCSPKAWRSA